MHIFNQLAKLTKPPVDILITVDRLNPTLDCLLCLLYHLPVHPSHSNCSRPRISIFTATSSLDSYKPTARDSQVTSGHSADYIAGRNFDLREPKSFIRHLYPLL